MCGFGVAQALLPPTGTAARPFGPSGALHTGGACAVVSHLEARPGSAAHGHRSLVDAAIVRPALSHVIPL